jgi:hypothetical protein
MDPTYETGLGNQSRINASFGTKLLDYDNDAFPDISGAKRHIMDNIQLYNQMVHYAEAKSMFRNIDGREFRDVSESLGPDFAARRVSRGAAVGDFRQRRRPGHSDQQQRAGTSAPSLRYRANQ